MAAIVLPVIVFLVALVFSMFGMGGGLIYMPVFLFFLGDHAGASILSFLCIFVTAVSAMSVYARKGLIDARLLGALGVPLVAVVFASGFFVPRAGGGLLRELLGTTLVLAGFFMAFPVKDLLRFERAGRAFKRRFPDARYRFAPWILTPLVLLIGGLSGMSGVAGGVFEIPVMVGLLGASAHTAVATSSAIVTMTALSGLLGRVAAGCQAAVLPWPQIAGVAVAALVGAQVGANISTRFDKRLFKRACGIFVMVMGVGFILK